MTTESLPKDHIPAVAYVDGSFDVQTKTFSYGVVFIQDGHAFQYSGTSNEPHLAEMHNIAGELMGAMRAMEIASVHKIQKLTIYHDYLGIAKWCTGEWRAKKSGTQAYKQYYTDMRRNIEIDFVHVKAHSGDYYNELADRLAAKALEKNKAVYA